MSSDAVIEVHGVGKNYHMYATPRDRLRQLVWGHRRRFYEDFHALQDISFDVAKGETLGIIGRNGSGKSTLLQILCGTLTPTTGRVATHGRIAAMLGYSVHSSFTRWFVAQFGVAPTVWRARKGQGTPAA